MKRLVASILLLVCSPLVVRAGLPTWTRFTLDNGLDVLIVENHLTPIVNIEVAVKNGSFTEPPDINGLSHLYEHMFFTANARDTTEDAFLGRVDDLGIVYNGETHEEQVEYYFTLPKENLESGLDFMATAITSPLFKEDELHKQKEVVLGEFDRNEANPFFRFNRKMDEAMWGNWLSRKEPLGTRPAIKAATREKMLAIKEKYYVPNNSLLLVTGDVTPDQARTLIPKYFKQWKKGADPFATNLPERVPALTHPILVLDTIDGSRTTVKVEWHGPSSGLDDKGTYVADVFSYIVTQREHEFAKSLIDSGLAQDVGFNYYTQRYVGPISATISTSPEHLRDAMKVFWQEVARFDSPDYISDDDLETAKSVIRTQTLYRSERLSGFSPGAYTQELAAWWATAGLDYYSHYLDDLSKVTKQDIAEYVRRYIQGKPYVLGIALSKAASIVTEPSLRSLGDPSMARH